MSDESECRSVQMYIQNLVCGKCITQDKITHIGIKCSECRRIILNEAISALHNFTTHYKDCENCKNLENVDEYLNWYLKACAVFILRYYAFNYNQISTIFTLEDHRVRHLSNIGTTFLKKHVFCLGVDLENSESY